MTQWVYCKVLHTPLKALAARSQTLDTHSPSPTGRNRLRGWKGLENSGPQCRSHLCAQPASRPSCWCMDSRQDRGHVGLWGLMWHHVMGLKPDKLGHLVGTHCSSRNGSDVYGVQKHKEDVLGPQLLFHTLGSSAKESEFLGCPGEGQRGYPVSWDTAQRTWVGRGPCSRCEDFSVEEAHLPNIVLFLICELNVPQCSISDQHPGDPASMLFALIWNLL